MGKKLELPACVTVLKQSKEKYAKKNGIRIDKKKMKKKELKRRYKKLDKEYYEAIIVGLNKGVKILTEVHKESKKLNKIKKGVEKIILNHETMDGIIKIYKKDPSRYNELKFFPYMILSTIEYYNSGKLSDEDKELAESIDPEKLIEFASSILKKEIKRYNKLGLSDTVAFKLAAAIPSTKILNKSIVYYKRLLNMMYTMSENESLDIGKVFRAVVKLDGKKIIKKKVFLMNFYREFILRRMSNKNYSLTDTQKEMHEKLIDMCLEFMNSLKVSNIKCMLKNYIKSRKKAEEFKSDGKRVIKFTDQVNSNSPYANIKIAVQEIISDDETNELYLG